MSFTDRLRAAWRTLIKPSDPSTWANPPIGIPPELDPSDYLFRKRAAEVAVAPPSEPTGPAKLPWPEDMVGAYSEEDFFQGFAYGIAVGIGAALMAAAVGTLIYRALS